MRTFDEYCEIGLDIRYRKKSYDVNNSKKNCNCKTNFIAKFSEDLRCLIFEDLIFQVTVESTNWAVSMSMDDHCRIRLGKK